MLQIANILEITGELKDNKMHGQGTFTYEDGTTDKGEWRYVYIS